MVGKELIPSTLICNYALQVLFKIYITYVSIKGDLILLNAKVEK